MCLAVTELLPRQTGLPALRRDASVLTRTVLGTLGWSVCLCLKCWAWHSVHCSSKTALSCLWHSSSNCHWFPPHSVPGSCLERKSLMNVLISPREKKLDSWNFSPAFLPCLQGFWCNVVSLRRAVCRTGQLAAGVVLLQAAMQVETLRLRCKAVPCGTHTASGGEAGQRDAAQILAKCHQDGLCYSNSFFCLNYSCTYWKAKVFPGGLKGLFPLSISVFAIAFLQLLLQAALCLPFEFTWAVHVFSP